MTRHPQTDEPLIAATDPRASLAKALGARWVPALEAWALPVKRVITLDRLHAVGFTASRRAGRTWFNLPRTHGNRLKRYDYWQALAHVNYTKRSNA